MNKKENDDEFLVIVRINVNSKQNAESLINAMEPILKKYQLVEIDKITRPKAYKRPKMFLILFIMLILSVWMFLL